MSIASGAPEILETRALLAAQIISSDAPFKTVAEGETIDIPVVYQTLDDNGAAAALRTDKLNFNLHYDTDVLSLVSVREVFAEDLQSDPTSALAESNGQVTGDDNDAATDTVLLANYVDSGTGTQGWPDNATGSGTTLYIARFTALAGFVETDINFSQNEPGAVVGGSGNFEFQSNPVTLQTPAGPTISVANAPTVTEGSNAVFTVSLNVAATETVTVSFSTEEGNGPSGALAGEDFTAITNQMLTFNPGETSKTVSVETINDFAVEGDEDFGIILHNPTGATIRGQRATATIQDDDAGLPALSISDAATVTEGETASFTVTLSTAATSVVTVDYVAQDGNGPTGANTGSDFADTSATLTFNPGETAKTITVATIDDSFSESDEVFSVVLTGTSNARISDGSGDATIRDNDSGLPFLQISDATSVNEGEVSEFTVTLSEAATSSITVSYSTSDGSGPTAATGGVDFVSQNNVVLTFAPGETSKTISVTTIDDTASETSEAFEVTLTEAIGASIDTAQAVGIIIDNDAGAQSGDVDGDTDFDANDSFLIHLVQLAGTNGQIDQAKGSSSQTAVEIRANISQLQTAGDVDGDSDFDANDSFLIHLVKLAGTNTQIDQAKGSSALTAIEIRANVDALNPPSGARSSAGGAPVVASVFADPGDSGSKELFDNTNASSNSLVVGDADQDAVTDSVWSEFRDWISIL